MMNHALQIRISFNHYIHLVFETIASLLSCIVYHEFLKLSIEPEKVHNKVTTDASQMQGKGIPKGSAISQTASATPHPAADEDRRYRNHISRTISAGRYHIPNCDYVEPNGKML